MRQAFPYCGAVERYDNVNELIGALNCTYHYLHVIGHDRSRCHCPKQCHETGTVFSSQRMKTFVSSFNQQVRNYISAFQIRQT